MSAKRIDEAMGRINAAMERIDVARAQISESSASESAAAQPDQETSGASDTAASARVMALVNAHEKLREEVADTIGEIDTLIDELNG